MGWGVSNAWRCLVQPSGELFSVGVDGCFCWHFCVLCVLALDVRRSAFAGFGNYVTFYVLPAIGVFYVLLVWYWAGNKFVHGTC